MAVSLLAMPAGATGLAGVGRVHQQQRYARGGRLVGKLPRKREESPGEPVRSLSGANRYSRPNPAEVFEREGLGRLGGFRRQGLADLVIHVPLETRFLPLDRFQPLTARITVVTPCERVVADRVVIPVP